LLIIIGALVCCDSAKLAKFISTCSGRRSAR